MRTKKKQPIDWLFPEVRKRILSLLLTGPEDRWYLRDIARRTGCALGTVRRELEGLTSAEIVQRMKDGNRIYYQANRTCPILPELAGLIRKTAGLANVLQSALASLADNIDLAFVYGSQASGDATAVSDVDLLIVGSMDEVPLVQAITKAEEQLGRTVNYTLLKRDEFKKRRKEKGGFLARVLAAKKIAILGNIDEV